MNNIKLKKDTFTATITLSKPPLNILDTDDLNYLNKILQSLNSQKGLKLIIIESNQKIFSAGVNISEHSKEKFPTMLEAFHKVICTMADLDVPILCLVKSKCIGGGFELALFCDMIVASDKASFSNPEIKLGCFPPVSLIMLPQLIGEKKALELILTGKELSAHEAENLNLVNHVFEENVFDQKVQELINSIISNSSSIIKITLKAYKKVNDSGLKDKLGIIEKIYFDELMNLKDSQEGLASFLEKRLPVWKEE